MAAPDLVMYEEEYQQIKDILQRLQVDSNSKIVFLVDKNGQQIAVHGDMRGVDATSLASLTAGNVAATDGLAKLIGEKEFSILFHEGEKRQHPHLARRAAGDPGGDLRREVVARPGAPARQEGVAGARADVRSPPQESPRPSAASMANRFDSPFAEITDEDIDSLFSE